ncbi:glycosyltransferase family 4 protein [Paenibacillus sp. 7124]|uniref:Glycosyltransferase family 4 protein n=1 Tax=Paenibacillus apii TaxID=1850370 RepID=A0A6M1PJ34_9BACL|nr:glycosyltransferase [Paenibacillus apii]NGM83577.1 glycosyltransferase family 4 protein [Paenibacillus apii]
MKTIVISGINLYEGGPLSVFKDCLDSIIKSKFNETNNVVAFVYKKELLIDYADKITVIELPKSRGSYLFRLWYEYIYFYFYSKDKTIDVWFSLHDITPNVKAKKRYVYCHNPSPFLKTELKNIKYSYKNFLFSLFYKYIYKINIKKNTAVIVQQDWIREEFMKMYKVNNVIVAEPISNNEKVSINNRININKDKFQFIYPAYPRFFKNFEVICEACKVLEKQGIGDFEVILTINGNENLYSHEIKKKYGKLSNIKFIGLLKREKLFSLYETVDCLIFSSTLETWGLPISEFKGTNKAIIVANLPYAKETVGTYDKVNFFDPYNAIVLAELMKNEISHNNVYTRSNRIEIKQPYAKNWNSLLRFVFD